MFNYRKGFTLIELLVVIFIIGLLASIVVVSVNTARVKSRDARRIADISSVRTAIELYIDANGIPPATANTTYESSNANWSTLQSTLASYIPVLPKDPRHGSSIRYIDTPSGNNCTASGVTSTARYRYRHNGTDYKLGSLLEYSCVGINTNDGGSYNSWYEVGSKVDNTIW